VLHAPRIEVEQLAASVSTLTFVGNFETDFDSFSAFGRFTGGVMHVFYGDPGVLAGWE
jgi:hypothetical protein